MKTKLKYILIALTIVVTPVFCIYTFWGYCAITQDNDCNCEKENDSNYSNIQFYNEAVNNGFTNKDFEYLVDWTQDLKINPDWIMLLINQETQFKSKTGLLPRIYEIHLKSDLGINNDSITIFQDLSNMAKYFGAYSSYYDEKYKKFYHVYLKYYWPKFVYGDSWMPKTGLEIHYELEKKFEPRSWDISDFVKNTFPSNASKSWKVSY